jgi:peptide/nickel transport system substrate-binding protein
MKRLFIFLTIFALLLSGCGKIGDGDSVDVDSIPEMGGTINLQMRTPDTIDPLLTERQTTRDALMIIYEPLFNITDNFGIEGVLAESYSFSSDATTLTVKLKSGVRWHNGERLTADDVLYTVNKIKENPKSSYYQNLSKLESVSKSGDDVVFKLSEPYHQFLYALYFPIENDGVDAANVCVGTGPYMMNEMTSRQMSLRRFDGWHGGSAYADNVTVFFMRTSSMAQEAFSSGKIHAVVSEMLDSENFALKEGMNKTEFPNGVFDFIGFNTKEGLFSDPLLRIALSNAIDRTSLDEGVASGFPVMTGSEMFSPSYETTSFDSEYAGEVIFSAGWTDSDYDGVPEKVTESGRERLSFTLLVREGDASRLQEAEKLSESMEAVGFDVTIDAEEEEKYNSRISSGEYEAFLGEVYLYTPYDLSLLLSSTGSVNYFGYNSAEMDEALKNAAAAADDSSFTSSFNAIQSLFVAEQPITGIAFENDSIVTQPCIMGDIKPYPYSPYANIYKWYLK